MKKEHLLIVEDDDFDFDSLKALFTTAHLKYLEINRCKTIEEAKGVLAEKRPNFVITDLIMGGDASAGIDLINYAKNSLSLSRSYYIIISGADNKTMDRAAFNAGAKFSFKKPIDPFSFRANITMVLENIWRRNIMERYHDDIKRLNDAAKHFSDMMLPLS